MTSNTINLSRRGFVQSAVAFSIAGGAASPVLAADSVKPGANSALIVIDVQNCFIDGGTLPVKGGAEVVPIINKLAGSFQNIVVTQDWHTPGHASFASAHTAKKPFETIGLSYGTQVLWPDHCVQGSDDAALHKDLKLPTAQLIIRKGFNKGVDSYSAFEEADRKTATGLAAYLKARSIDTV
ncbi:MAG: isochorismatase family protein, partial [Reyranella sp.]